MCVFGGNALSGQLYHFVTVIQQVDRVVARKVSTFEQDPFVVAVRHQFAQFFGDEVHFLQRLGRAGIKQDTRFGQIGGNHGGKRDKCLF